MHEAAAPATAVTAVVNKEAGAVSRRHRTPSSSAPAASSAACTTHAGPASAGATARSSRPLESDRSSTSPGGAPGASGAAYGLRLLEVLLERGIQVQLMISAPGRMVIAEETDLRLPSRSQEIATILRARFGAPDG